jgi:NADH-quinone oxidoreductase subunit D
MAEIKDFEFEEMGSKSVQPSNAINESLGDVMTLSMGPSQPSMHGVLRFKAEVDGEIFHRITPDIGYLHRVMKKLLKTKPGINLFPIRTV